MLRQQCPNLVDFFVIVALEDLHEFGEGGIIASDVEDVPSPEDLPYKRYAGSVLSSFPPHGRHGDCELPENTWMFCLPDGAQLSMGKRPPSVHSFVLTELTGTHMFGTCITFDEPYTPADGAELEFPLYAPKAMCILSHWRYFSLFRDILCEIYRLHLEGEPLCVESIVQHVVLEVPLPPPGLIDVQFSVGTLRLEVSRPPVNDFPHVDVDCSWLFQCFDPVNALTLFRAVLCEQQILLVSSQFSLLTTVAETLVALMFPLRWEHVYIPVLPSMLSNFIYAPMPFIMGMQPSSIPEDGLPDELFVAYIDDNSIKMGNAPIPRLPDYLQKKLLKRLSSCLDSSARSENQKNLSPNLIIADAAFPPTYSPRNIAFNEAQETAHGTLKERLTSEQSSIPPAEWETCLALHTPARVRAAAKEPDSPSKLIRQAFLRFIISLLKTYSRHITIEESEEGGGVFDIEEFLKDNPSDNAELLTVLVGTTAFSMFVEERAHPVTMGLDFEALFFDESIDAKVNKSMFTLSKKVTPFLSDRSFSVTETYHVEPPEVDPANMVSGGEYFPLLDSSKFTKTEGSPPPIARDVTLLLEYYARRIVNDRDYFKERIEEQEFEESHIDWTMFDGYARDIPSPPEYNYHYRRPELEATDDAQLHWVEVPRKYGEPPYYYNTVTLRTRHEPPTFYVTFAEYAAQVVAVDELRKSHKEERRALYVKQSKEINALGDEIVDMIDEVYMTHAEEWAHLLERQASILAAFSEANITDKKERLEIVKRETLLHRRKSNLKMLRRMKEKSEAEAKRKQDQIASLRPLSEKRRNALKQTDSPSEDA